MPKRASLIRKTPGLSRAADTLNKQGYDIQTVDWENIHSTHASLMVIPSPTQTLSATDTNHVTQFLRDGGRLLILSDPSSQDSLTPLLSSWGIQLGTGILADEQDRLGRGSPTALMVRTFTTHDITENFTTPIIFPVSRSVTFDANEGENWDFEPLVHTSPKSWEETTLTNTEPVFDEGVDPKGPFAVAAVLMSKRVGQDQKPESAIVIVGKCCVCHQWMAHVSRKHRFFSKNHGMARTRRSPCLAHAQGAGISPVCAKPFPGTIAGLFSSPLPATTRLIFRPLRVETKAKPITC